MSALGHHNFLARTCFRAFAYLEHWAVVVRYRRRHAEAYCQRSFDDSRTGWLLVPPQKGDSTATCDVSPWPLLQDRFCDLHLANVTLASED